jgi:hypothetical protein
MLGEAGCGAIAQLMPFSKDLRQLWIGHVSAISSTCRDAIEMARIGAPRQIEVYLW